jgi:hypothetical protein
MVLAVGAVLWLLYMAALQLVAAGQQLTQIGWFYRGGAADFFGGDTPCCRMNKRR